MEAHSVYVVTFHLASLLLLVKQINHSSIGGTISVSLILYITNYLHAERVK